MAIVGRIDFEIESLATGYILAPRRSKGGQRAFELDGRPEFDTKMFDKADIGLSYKGGKWGVKGELAVGPDKIKGIKKATAKVAVDDEIVTADGEFETASRASRRASSASSTTQPRGWRSAAEIVLGKGIPGIKSGKLDATVKQGAARLDARRRRRRSNPTIPGVDAAITGRYDDGAFDVDGTIGYERGIAKGAITVGVTNGTVGEDGKPTGRAATDGSAHRLRRGHGHPHDHAVAAGHGRLKLLPNGEIEVVRRGRARRRRSRSSPRSGREEAPLDRDRHPDRRRGGRRPADRHLRHHQGRRHHLRRLRPGPAARTSRSRSPTTPTTPTTPRSRAPARS